MRLALILTALVLSACAYHSQGVDGTQRTISICYNDAQKRPDAEGVSSIASIAAGTYAAISGAGAFATAVITVPQAVGSIFRAPTQVLDNITTTTR